MTIQPFKTQGVAGAQFSNLFVGQYGQSSVSSTGSDLMLSSDQDVSLTSGPGNSVNIINGNLNVNGSSLGFVSLIGGANNLNGAIWIDAVASDSTGNIYGVGGSYIEDVECPTLNKFDTKGNLIWQSVLFIEEDNFHGAAEGIALINDIPIVMVNDYSNSAGNIVLLAVSPLDGSLVSPSDELNTDVAMTGSDIAVSHSNIYVVGTRINDTVAFNAVTPISGSNVGILGVSKSIFGEGDLPTNNDFWTVTGYQIEGDTEITGVNTFLVNPVMNTHVAGGSILFDGSNPISTVDEGNVLQTGTGDFIIETWMKATGNITADAGPDPFRGNIVTGNTFGGLSFYIRSVDNTSPVMDTIGIELQGTETVLEAPGLLNNINDDNWHYVVAQRSSSVGGIYFDGTLVAVGSLSNSCAPGENTSLGDNLEIELTNFRVSNDVALYGGSMFSPTGPLSTNEHTTVLLDVLSEGNVFVDLSNNNNEFTGDATYSSDSPYLGFDLSVIIQWDPNNGVVSATIGNEGEEYFVGDILTVSGVDIGGISPDNDCQITITDIDSDGEVQSFTTTGTGPFNNGNIFFTTDDDIDFSQTLTDGNAWNIMHQLNNDAMIWSNTWQYFIGKENNDGFNSVAIDSNEFIYAGGFYYNNDESTISSMLVKFDKLGDVQWSKSINDDQDNNVIYSLVVDSTDNVFVSSTNTNSNLIITKLTSDGQIVWQSRIGAEEPMGTYVHSITVDSNDNPITSGVINSVIANGDDIYLIKLRNSDGSLLWQNSLGTLSDDEQEFDVGTRHIATSGNSIVIGGFTNDISSSPNAFLAKLPTNGSGLGNWGDWTYVVQPWAVEQLMTSSVDISGLIINTGDIVANLADLDTTSFNQYIQLTNIGTSGGNIINVGDMVFVDGTVQATGYAGSVNSWTDPDEVIWRIESYSDGASISFDGSTPILWFDASNAISRGIFSGAIISYHALLPSDGTVIIGEIIIASGAGSNNVTHTETSSSFDSSSGLCSWWNRSGTEGQLFFTGRNQSEPMFVQWTSKIFFGYENFC